MKPQRMMAEIEGDFAVFLIGMKLNRPWRVDRWAPLALAMLRMLRDLRSGAEPGFLGAASRLVPVTPEFPSPQGGGKSTAHFAPVPGIV
jgi:hypothetical protein